MSLPAAFRIEALRIEALGVVDSTQEEMRRRLEAGADVHGCLLRATAQRRGRGRQRRAWESREGGSYQTLALRDETGRYRSGLVPIAVAVGIAEAFARRGVRLLLKWPNDLYLPPGPSGGRPGGKLGGILCEHLRNHLLVGVGMNVRNVPPAGAAALEDSDPLAVSDTVLDGIRSGLSERLHDGELPERFALHDLLRGRLLCVREGERELVGRGGGVSRHGCLLLESESGTLETCGGRVVEVDPAAG